MAAANFDHLSKSSFGKVPFKLLAPNPFKRCLEHCRCLLEELVAVTGYFSKRIEIDRSVTINKIRIWGTKHYVLSSTKR